MIRSRLTIKTAWPFLLIILVMVAGGYFGCLWAGHSGRHADAHQNTAAGGRGTRPQHRNRFRRRPRSLASVTPSPAADSRTYGRSSSADGDGRSEANRGRAATRRRLRPPPHRSAKVDGSMGSPDYGVQDFLWWRPEVADRDLQLTKEAGFNWVKQLVSWQDVEGAGKGQYDWTNLDRIVGQAEQPGPKLIVRVSQDPDRPFWAG